MTDVHVCSTGTARAPNKSKHISSANSLIWAQFWGGKKRSSPWLWSSPPPPPVTSLTITLSELFLLLCGKMAERKCVYTVILLSVCAVWPRPEISFGMLSSIFCKNFLFLSTPTHIPISLSLSVCVYVSLSLCVCLSLSPPPKSPSLYGTLSSPVTEEADRIAIAITWLVTLC